MSTKQTATNSFGKGLVTDLHPLIAPDDVLTDCINGTIITLHGNEYTLQNDLGNIETEGCLKEGFTPVSSCVHDGIWYIMSVGNVDGKNVVEFGTYPSPAVNSINEDEISSEDSLILELTDGVTYTYQEIQNKLDNINKIFNVKEGDFYAISMNDAPDFLNVSYKNLQTGKLINPLSDVPTRDDFIENFGSNANILLNVSIAPFTFDVEQKLFVQDGKLKGTININYDELLFKNSDLTFDIYMNSDHIGNFGNSSNIEYPTSDSKIILKIVPIVTSKSVSLQYSEYIEELDVNRLPSNQLDIFSNYYYKINSSNFEVFFTIDGYEELIPKTIDWFIEDVVFENDTYSLNKLYSGKSEIKDGLFKQTIDFSNDIVKDHMYVFGIKLNSTEYRKLLFTSDSFNQFIDYSKSNLDFSSITADQWLSYINIDPIDVDLTLTDGSKNFVTNDSKLEFRSYIPKYNIDGTTNKNHTEFIKNYIPYIYTNACDVTDISFHPSCAIQTSKKVNISDGYKTINNEFLKDVQMDRDISLFQLGTEITTETEKEGKISDAKISMVEGYRLYLAESDSKYKTIYDREYLLQFEEPIIFKFDISKFSDNANTIYSTSINSEYKISNTFEYLRGVVDENNTTLLQLFSGSFLNKNYKLTPDYLGYTYDGIRDPNYDFTSDYFESEDTSNVNSVLYKMFLNPQFNNSLFIPVKFETNNDFISFKIETETINNKSCYALMVVSKNSTTGLAGALIKIDNNYIHDDLSFILDIANTCNKHIYVQHNTVSFDITSLKATDVEYFAESYPEINRGELKMYLKNFSVNNTNSEVAIKLLGSTFDISNLKIDEQVQINVDLNVNSVDSQTVIQNSDLDQIRNELLELKDYINNNWVLDTQQKVVNSNFNDWVFDNNGIKLDSSELKFIDDICSDLYYDDVIYKNSNFTKTFNIINTSTDGGLNTFVVNLCGLDSNINIDSKNVTWKETNSLYQNSGSFSNYLKHFNYEIS